MNNIERLIRNKLFKQALAAMERDIYLRAYEFSDYNQAQAARLLGVSRGTFISRLKHWQKGD